MSRIHLKFYSLNFLPTLIILYYKITMVHCGFFDELMDIAASGVCYLKDECCYPRSIPGDINKLQEMLNKRVYGQHIASDIVVNAIAAHWKTQHAKKALTISFHGFTGSGKNYVSQIIAESLFTKGMQSKYVTLFSPSLQFYEHSQINEHQRELYYMIKNKVSNCERQLFIFDEIEKMPEGILNGIKSILDYHENIGRVDYRKSIFIFLSNIGTSAISKHYLSLWRAGRTRDSIKLSDFEKMISEGAFNNVGGFFHSEMIKSNLIDHYVPFLPMEREHVEACIHQEFAIRGMRNVADSLVEEVLSSVEFAPAPEYKFAKTGCKRISQKVAAIAFKQHHARRYINHVEL